MTRCLHVCPTILRTPRHIGAMVLLVVIGLGCRSEPAQENGATAEQASADTAESGLSDPATDTTPLPRLHLPTPTDLRAALDRAWQGRDQLESVPIQNGYSPIEYAPHVWRQLVATLLSFDAQARSGRAFRKTELTEKVTSIGNQFERLREGPAGGTAIIDRLRAELLDREMGTAPERWSQNNDLMTLASDAIRLRQRLGYRAHDYVRWYANVAYRSQYEPLQVLQSHLLQGLEQLVLVDQRLRNLEETHLSELLLSELRSTLDAAEAQFSDAERLFDGFVDAVIDNLDRPEWRGLASAMLDSPLLDAEQRQRFRVSLEDASIPEVSDSSLVVAEAPQLSNVGGLDVRQVVRHLELELGLLRLFDNDEAERLRKQIERIEQTSTSDKERMSTEIEQASEIVSRAYRRLPEQAEQLAAGPRERVLLAVDPRDAHRVGTANLRQLLPAMRVLPPRIEERLVVSQTSGGTPIMLEERQFVPFELLIEATLPNVIDAKVEIRYPEQQMQLRALTSSGPTKVDSRNALTLPTNQTVRFEIAALRTVSSGGDPAAALKSIAFEVSAGSKRERLMVQCRLPRPNNVALHVDRPWATVVGQGARLRPFPNRTSSFQFSLANMSDKDKRVDVRLYRVERHRDANFLPGRIPSHWIDRLAIDGSQPIAATEELRLPAGGERISISWRSPQAGGDETAADGAGASDDRPPQPINVTHGMKLVVTDGEQTWEKWIEVETLRPSEYLSLETNYDRLANEVRVRVFPRAEGDGLPTESGFEIPVVWNTRDELNDGFDGQYGGTLTQNRGEVTLTSKVPSNLGRRLLKIPITIDGYPRAFVHAVEIGRDNRGIDVRANWRSRQFRPEIRLDAVKHAQRIYLASRSMPVPELAEGEELRYLESTMMAPFMVERGEPVLVDFHFDAPPEAFGNGRSNDVVEMGWEGQPLQFFSDRRVNVTVNQVTDDGGLLLETTVGDYQSVVIAAEGRLGPQRIVANGRLLAGGQGVARNYRGETLTVILDAKRPTIDAFRLASSSVLVGTPLNIQLSAQDASEIASIRLGLTDNRDDPLPENSLSFGTSDRKQLPTDKVGTFWVQAEVTDRAGHRMRTGDVGFEPQRVRVTAPRQPDANGNPGTAPPAKIVGTLRGYVQFGENGAKIANAKVSIVGTNQRTESASGGAFQFDNIEAGEYELEATSLTGGKRRKGTGKVTIEKQSDFSSKTVRIVLE